VIIDRIVCLAGPHPIWSDRAASPLKRQRVTARLTQMEVANRAPCSLSAYSNLEARGIGSDDLWKRVAAVFDVPVDAIRPPRSPAGEPADDLQGELELG